MSNATEGGLKAETMELVEKLISTMADDKAKEDAIRDINFSLRNKLIKQQKFIGEPLESVGISPKERDQMKVVFDKYADGNVIKAAELKQLTEDLAEPLTDEEIEEGIKQMDKDGNGVIDFEEFCKWMQEEREKDSHQGVKMKMLKLKMRANQFKKEAEAGIKKKPPCLSANYSSIPENLCRVTKTVTQGGLPAAKTEIDLEFKSTEEAAGRALMDAAGAPADAKACVCVSIAMFPSEGDCSGELQAIYEQIFDMAEGDKIIEEKGQDMYLHGKPSLRVVDGVLQLTVSFTIDPLVDMLSLDSRYLKTLEGHIKWAHSIDEVLKEEGEEIDLMVLDGLQTNVKLEADRKLLEWISSSPELSEYINQTPEAAQIISAALCFGNLDINANVRTVTEMINPVIAENLESYSEFIEMIEDRRRIPAEMIGGITDKMVEMYCRVPDPVKAIYGVLKSKIAGPLKVEAITPTANTCLSTKGLDCAHKFFPSVEEIEAHPGFDLDGDGSDEEVDW
jgi:Ca2+-binding EF-hand superfamily protein